MALTPAGCDVLVVGAGVVGIATALSLRAAGLTVELMDQAEPGRGCSFGNAGIIANSYVEPLSNLQNLIHAPRMLLDPLGPLAIRPSRLMDLAPWLLAFAAKASPASLRRSTSALKSINGVALPAWRRLLTTAGALDLLRERGMLDVVRTADRAPALRSQVAALKAEGIKIELVDGGAATDLEPALAGRVAAAALHVDVAHVADPYLVSKALFDRFVAVGGVFRSARISGLSPDDAGVTVHGTETARASTVVVCAGYWSAELLRPLGVRAPIATERGYHLWFGGFDPGLSRPVSFHDESFVATPMRGGLRLAGTVELALPQDAPDWRRAEQLRTLATPYLPGLETSSGDRWMGCRPSFADSLPAIGRCPSTPRILYAFGHQHLGLTQAAATAEAVVALAHDRPPPFALEPFDLRRFGGGRAR